MTPDTFINNSNDYEPLSIMFDTEIFILFIINTQTVVRATAIATA